MAIQREHELHSRRRGRNVAMGLILGGLVAMIFAVSIVKLSQSQSEDSTAPNYVPATAGASE
ncbi:MAG: cytochrome C oxidase assembly protein [Rhodobacteraceae bacterium]|nr:cytochrome C oxidase assembly protein [Paracoccaceae bacterium]